MKKIAKKIYYDVQVPDGYFYQTWKTYVYFQSALRYAKALSKKEKAVRVNEIRVGRNGIEGAAEVWHS